MRISVQLIDVESDRHLWAQNYDRTLEDIFAIQSEIANKSCRIARVAVFFQKKDIGSRTRIPEMLMLTYSI